MNFFTSQGQEDNTVSHEHRDTSASVSIHHIVKTDVEKKQPLVSQEISATAPVPEQKEKVVASPEVAVAEDIFGSKDL